MNLAQFMDGIQAAAAMAGPIAATALWQGAAIALGLALCLRLTPRVSANVRFVVWTAGFAALVALPFLQQIAQDGVAMGSGPGLKPWLQVDLRWGVAIGALWMVGSLIRVVDLAIHCLRLRRLWKAAVPVKQRMALPARAGGRKTVEICTTQELDRPSVIGFFAPRILIPEWLYERLTGAELDQIVLHEVEHLRRCDDWTNLLQKLCLVLFPLNPALWWMERQLCKEREMACDEGVIAITQAPRAYAACLTSLAERGLERKAEALSLGAWQRRPELVRRVQSILRRGRILSPVASGALVATLGGSLLVVSIELARCPQFVAFVPTQNTTLTARSAQDEGTDAVDAVYRLDAHRMAGFRAVETKSVMQAAKPVAHMQSAATHRRMPKSAAGTARVQEIKTKLTAPRTGPTQEKQDQQWIMLTSWEQIVTSRAPAAADMRSDEASNSDSQPGIQIATRITVTQLVFKVVRADSKSSQSSQPKAVFRDGWLVFQL